MQEAQKQRRSNMNKKIEIKNRPVYYVIGNDRLPFATDLNKIDRFDSIDEAKDEYDLEVRELRFNNIYLIADFGTSGNWFFHNKISKGKDNILPFFIIGEWHIDMDWDKSIRKDLTILTSKEGVQIEYLDNYLSMKNAERYILDGYPFVYQIGYGKYIIEGDNKVGKTVYKTIYRPNNLTYNKYMNSVKLEPDNHEYFVPDNNIKVKDTIHKTIENKEENGEA